MYSQFCAKSRLSAPPVGGAGSASHAAATAKMCVSAGRRKRDIMRSICASCVFAQLRNDVAFSAYQLASSGAPSRIEVRMM